MINVMKLGDKTIGECENCGCRFAYGEENIKDFKLYGGGKLQTIMSYVLCRMPKLWNAAQSNERSC